MRSPWAFLVAVLVLLSACGSSPPESAGTDQASIRVASYDFRENQILAEVYAEALRRRGLPVTVQHGIGTREVVSPALQQGVVDVVIDYLGTALSFARADDADLPTDREEARAELSRFLAGRGVLVLEPSGAEDQNGFAVTTAFAADHGVGRLSQLEDLAPDLVFGGPPECPDRPFCLAGLEAVYGLRFGEVRSMPSRAATVEALVSGEIDVGLLETTDARLASAPIQLLLDDRALQPHENVVPLVRTDVVDRYGSAVRAALDEVSARLTTNDLVELNQAVEIDGETPADAAAAWWN
jgi:osmoprotectant transport system substrate-binding protein